MGMKKIIIIALIVTVAVGLGVKFWPKHPTTFNVANKTQGQASNKTNTPASTFDKTQYSTTDPSSIWVVVNKQHPLIPKNYVPADLVVPAVPLRVPGNESMQVRQVTAIALQTMFAAAKAQGINLMLSSGYRSFAYQTALYNGYVKTQGQAVADTQSARPGFSEHQTGLAADIEPTSEQCDVDPCFGNLPEGKWLAANAYKYGFIIRYTPGNQAITGYVAEAWHVRYVGTALSNEMRSTGIETLEQFFNISGGPNY